MPLAKSWLSLVAFWLASVSTLAQAPGAPLLPHEPVPNLGELKTHLLAYHDCTGTDGCYADDLKHQAGAAIAWLDQRLAKSASGEKMAIVLDIDETSLSNWEVQKKDDFGYIGKDWEEWEKSEKAPAIPGTLALYNDALAHHVAVFFITGRDESDRTITVANLTKAGYHNWAGLALRGSHSPAQTVIEYKSGERKKIVDAGYTIVVNMGDQFSDLNGLPQAELSVKLPNPFYYIP